MMKISQVFYLQEKSITLRLFPIRYESASAETIKEPFALQSYKIVVNNEQNAKKKITSLREVLKTLKRTSPTSAVKSGNFSAEVCQLLTRSFRSRRAADFAPAVHLENGFVLSPDRTSRVGTSYKLLKNRTVNMRQNLCLPISV